MTQDLAISTVAQNAAVDALCDLLDLGYLRIYDGARPATAETAVTSQSLLAELRFAASAFPAAVNGVATANALTADSAANASGTATWFRALRSDGATAIFDGNVGASPGDFDMTMPTVSIVALAEVHVTSCTFTFPKT